MLRFIGYLEYRIFSTKHKNTEKTKKEKALLHFCFLYFTKIQFELKDAGVSLEIQKPIQINYKRITFEEAFRANIIVNELIILELKPVKTIEDIHTKQLLTYLRLTDKKLGLLINFNEPLLKNEIKRVINGKI